ncbi:MAG: PAS domain S-box protein [bacterium]
MSGNKTQGAGANADRAPDRPTESDAFQRLIIDLLPHLISAKDSHGTLLHANKALAAAYMTTVDDLVGTRQRDWHEAGPEIDQIEAADREALAAGEPHTVQREPFTDKNGNTRILQTTRVPFTHPDRDEPALLSVAIDVTELELVAQALRDNEARLRLILANSPVGIGTLQPDGRFRMANAVFCEMLGYPLDELRRLTLGDIAHPAERDSCWWHLGRLLSDEHDQLRFENRFVHKNGQEIHCALRVSLARDAAGQPQFIVFVAEDVTSARRSEDDQQQLDTRLRMSQKLESLGVLAGGIAHGFNNLLMAILANIDLALMEMSPVSPEREGVEQARAAAQRAADLCRQLQIYAGKADLATKPVDLSTVIQTMAKVLELSIGKAVLSFNLASGLPSISADASQIRQVILNLVTNASDAIQVGGGDITVTTGSRHFGKDELRNLYLNETLAAGQYVFLEVTDTGHGMTGEEIGKIFDPYYSTKAGGHGFGLAITLGIIRSHQGAVEVRSEVDQGTTVMVLFPCADSEAPSSDQYIRTPFWRGSGNVLVVDDDEHVCLVVTQMLKRLGFEVITAHDGREAIELFRSRADDIKLVLVDMAMPYLSGEEVFLELQQIRPGIRVILSSGYDLSGVADHLIQKGLSGFINKPYQMDQLSQLFQGVLQD